MISVPKKVAERLTRALKPYTKVLAAQRDRDVSEADTVTLVKDVLADVFGFDKYSEITGEYAIRGTRCDLAIKLDGKMAVLLEVKAIGADLNDRHVKQAIDYAANQGVEWVLLTNAIRWVLYHVLFKQPIDKEEVACIDLLDIDPKKEEGLERLYLLTKEGIERKALVEYRDRKDATSRYMLAAILVESDSVVSAIRREVRKVSDIMVDPGAIIKVLREEVIKRDLLEGPQAQSASRRFSRNAERPLRQTREDRTCEPTSTNTSPRANSAQQGT